MLDSKGEKHMGLKLSLGDAVRKHTFTNYHIIILPLKDTR